MVVKKLHQAKLYGTIHYLPMVLLELAENLQYFCAVPKNHPVVRQRTSNLTSVKLNLRPWSYC